MSTETFHVRALWVDGHPVGEGDTELVATARRARPDEPTTVEWDVRVNSDELKQVSPGEHRIECEVAGGRRFQGLVRLGEYEGTRLLFEGIGELEGLDPGELD